MPTDANMSGDIFGGWLMSQMDLGASVVARQRARGRTATASCENLQFIKPVYVGDLVSIHSWMIREGRSSMRIGVQGWARRNIFGAFVQVSSAEFTFVAIDGEGRSRPLPPPEA